MLTKRVLACCILVIAATFAGNAPAQECGPFFFLCQRPADPRYQAVPPPPQQVEPRYVAPGEPRYEPRYAAPPEPRYAAPPEPRYAAPPGYGGYERPGYERQDFGRQGFERQDLAAYGPVRGEPFPVPAVRMSEVDPNYLRRAVSYPSNEPPGTIIVDPGSRYLYAIEGGGRAMRYGIGVGRQGFAWSGVATIRDKQEWPDWYPPKEMLQRQPELARQMSQLQSGIGMEGGPRNPLGARALYLWQGNKDTLYRIHGTNEPWTIGRSVSSGCIRMLNQDVIDLYERTPLGAKVVVLGSRAG
jgi:lipoprotein-anchoring transpeptidase ErfK/SrfK